MNDDELAEHMCSCHIDGSQEIDGFTLHAGRDESGRPCLWIENQLKGAPSGLSDLAIHTIEKSRKLLLAFTLDNLFYHE